MQEYTDRTDTVPQSLNAISGGVGSAFRSDGKLGNLINPRSSANKIITIFQ